MDVYIHQKLTDIHIGIFVRFILTICSSDKKDNTIQSQNLFQKLCFYISL